jgi:uncharacterized protein (TIGR03032 family)
MEINKQDLNKLHESYSAMLRDPNQIAAQWQYANETDKKLLEYKTKGPWWDILSELNTNLIVTREYEHTIIILGYKNNQESISFFRLPHPSGIAVDTNKKAVYIASTRNPNQIFKFISIQSIINRDDADNFNLEEPVLLPVSSQFYPGSTYMHELAFINNQLYANSVGTNSIIRFNNNDSYDRVWWPKCIEILDENKRFAKNYLQLNSIAAGDTINNSYFTASVSRIEKYVPGDIKFPVNKNGVVFSGKTREPIASGLTRPHSAKLYNEIVWVDNSGYGEFGNIMNQSFNPIIKLQGWTRGLFIKENIAFVGTSHILSRYKSYAPGVDYNKTNCGISAIDLKTSQIIASMIWPYGNQIFSIEGIPYHIANGFPFYMKPRQNKNFSFHVFYQFKK